MAGLFYFLALTLMAWANVDTSGRPPSGLLAVTSVILAFWIAPKLSNWRQILIQRIKNNDSAR
jgi:hypothetical protein